MNAKSHLKEICAKCFYRTDENGLLEIMVHDIQVYGAKCSKVLNLKFCVSWFYRKKMSEFFSTMVLRVMEPHDRHTSFE